MMRQRAAGSWSGNLRQRAAACAWIVALVLAGSKGAWAQVHATDTRGAVSFAASGTNSVTESGSLRTGAVHGMVTDAGDAAVPGAVVTLLLQGAGVGLEAASEGDGAFAFTAVPVGAYRVRVARPGFAAWTSQTLVAEGQDVDLGGIALAVSEATSVVEVRASGRDIAEAQVELEEKQRELGVFPNFYASYAADPEPLTAGQKFRLAWRFSTDPVAFAMAGVVAGTEQSENGFSGYGHGLRGYTKRFGATYADGFNSTMLGQAILPAMFHQDPRYLVKGTGSVRARTMYALASTVMCKGDNRRWQVNYSNLLGNVGAAGISNAYYPANSGRGLGATAQTALVTTALGAAGGLIQEFFLHRMTPHVPNYGAVH